MDRVPPGAQGTKAPQVHEEWDLKSVVFPPANEVGAELSITPPATAKGTLAARRLLEQISAESLGIHQPSAFLLSLSPDKDTLWLLPTLHCTAPSALYIAYHPCGFRINLYKPFRLLGRLIREPIREVYTLEPTPEPIQIGDTVGRALVLHLNEFTRKPIRHLGTEGRRGGGLA